MLFNWDHSINVDKAISDLSDRRFVMIAKIVESSAYLVNDVFSSSLNSKSLRNTLKRYGPLTLPCIVPLLTALHSLVIPLYNSLSSIRKETHVPIYNIGVKRTLFQFFNQVILMFHIVECF